MTLTALVALSVEAAGSAGPSTGMRILGGAIAVVGLLAVIVALYLRLHPSRMSAKPYRPSAPPYDKSPDS